MPRRQSFGNQGPTGAAGRAAVEALESRTLLAADLGGGNPPIDFAVVNDWKSGSQG